MEAGAFMFCSPRLPMASSWGAEAALEWTTGQPTGRPARSAGVRRACLRVGAHRRDGPCNHEPQHMGSSCAFFFLFCVFWLTPQSNSLRPLGVLQDGSGVRVTCGNMDLRRHCSARLGCLKIICEFGRFCCVFCFVVVLFVLRPMVTLHTES